MKLSIDKNIQEFLEEFNLSEREIVIYLSLLKTGPNTIMNLARETGIKRSTTHNNVEELIKKGLVSQTNYGERRMVVAEDPDKLKFLLDQKKWKMKKMEDNLDSVVDTINKMIPEARENTEIEVKYYDGERGFKEVCERSLAYANDEILFISNLDEWYKIYTEEYDRDSYVPKRLEKNLNLKILAPEGDMFQQLVQEGAKDNKLLREIRLLKDADKFHSTYIIYGNEVSMMISSEPYTAIVLQVKDIAESFRSLFYSYWNNIK